MKSSSFGKLIVFPRLLVVVLPVKKRHSQGVLFNYGSRQQAETRNSKDMNKYS